MFIISLTLTQFGNTQDAAMSFETVSNSRLGYSIKIPSEWEKFYNPGDDIVFGTQSKNEDLKIALKTRHLDWAKNDLSNHKDWLIYQLKLDPQADVMGISQFSKAGDQCYHVSYKLKSSEKKPHTDVVELVNCLNYFHDRKQRRIWILEITYSANKISVPSVKALSTIFESFSVSNFVW